jgi:hypothetical protein
MALKDDEFEIGQSGIDTQYERDYINYRPKIEYKQPKVDASFGLSVDTASQGYDFLQEINQSTIASVWEDVVEAIQGINNLEATLAEKLKDVSAPIAPAFQEAIAQAANELGYSGITDSIPFDLYKKTFEVPESDSSTLIQEAYEDYMADVNGTLNAELYTDAAELKNDWADMLDFMNKGLFAQIVSIDEVPNEVKVDDTNMDAIKAKEKAMTDEYAQLLRLKAIDEKIYEQLYQTEYGSDRFWQASKELDDIKRQLVKKEKRLFTKTEIVDLVSRKASDTNDNVELIINSIDFDPYSEDKQSIIYGLLKQFGTKDAMQTGLKKMQAVLKLAVDSKKAETDVKKSSLRGIAGRTSKQETNQTLVNGVHLRNEVFGEVYDIMNNFDGIPGSDDFATVATHISDGIEQADTMYRSQASDFYKIHRMDNEVRTDKLTSLIDKDAARSAYQLIGKVLQYSTDTNKVWPEADGLSAWVANFMEHNNLN